MVSTQKSISSLQDELEQLRQDIIAQRDQYWVGMMIGAGGGGRCAEAWWERIGENVRVIYKAWDCTKGASEARVEEIFKTERRIWSILNRISEALTKCSTT